MYETRLDFEKNRNDPYFSCNDLNYGFSIEDDENYKRYTTKTWLFKNFNTDKFWMDADGVPVPFLYNNKIYTPGMRGDLLYIIRLIKFQPSILSDVLMDVAKSITTQGNFLTQEIKDKLIETINSYFDKTQLDDGFVTRGPHIRLTYIIPRDAFPESGILETKYFKISNYAPSLYTTPEICELPVEDQTTTQVTKEESEEESMLAKGAYNKLKIELGLFTKEDQLFNVKIGHNTFVMDSNTTKFIQDDFMEIRVEDGRSYKYAIHEKEFNRYGIFSVATPEVPEESYTEAYKNDLLKALNEQTSNKMAVGKFIAEHNVALQKVLSGMLKNETALVTKDKETTGLIKELLKLMSAL